ncbi:UDP-GlcNAc:betaGal beta-1,3-N-acetylglucosaminyltransferase 9 [Tachyglossus aculeatus]|uniref:UDP-GlcNAc:betaGal beta-1,3-N-acetylglucosaminyltransferase 9 n=1 Tax=Tachyglossus aculeatus TaxID=9261 RepID=UPI0018F75F93|nr:UDP-GlcNAc:betaGal beta-1,3-N-acetylglucosaminyltransferase 9 [Tachyglossus aculeatus]
MRRWRWLRLRGDVFCTLLLGATLCGLLYFQLELGAPGPSLPKARPKASAPPRVFSQAGPEAEGRVGAWGSLLHYEADTPEPPTPPDPFDFDQYLRDKDRRDFDLLINQPHKCQGLPSRGPDLLIAVKSVMEDFGRREVVRQTWGREGLVRGAWVRRVFLLGVPRPGVAPGSWESLLQQESGAYGDILLWAFQDTFFNLTLKELHFLAWADTYCPAAHFVFQGDIDVFVHVENLLTFLEPRDPSRALLVGDVILDAQPIRARNSKYYIPKKVYGLGVYPAYAGGGGFLLSGAAVHQLSRACREVELFPIDDVFLGMCLQRIGLRPEPHSGFRTFGIPRPSAAPHLQPFDPCFYQDLMVVHSLTGAEIWLMWQLLHGPPLDCARRGRVQEPFRWVGGKGAA